MANREENPYKELVQQVQKLGCRAGLQATACIGVVVSPPPNIVVAYNGMQLDKQYLWIDEYWLQGHARTNKGNIVSATQNRAGGGGYAEFAGHNHDINNPYTDTEIKTDTWKPGDKVLMIPIVGDDNKTAEQFVILCKLKRLDGGS